MRSAIHFTGRVPLLTQIYNDPSIAKWIKQNGSSYDLLWCHLIRTAEFAHNFEGPTILDMADSIGHHYTSAQSSNSLLWRTIRSIEGRKTIQYEISAAHRFNRIYVHTNRDLQALSKLDPTVKDTIKISPMGIQDEYFDNRTAIRSKETNSPRKIAFLGKMNYEPNIDAVQHFVDDIFPLIRASVPDANFQIVGAYPTSKVLKLGAKPGVEVTGFVESAAHVLGNADVVVAPMRIGGGIQNKVIQAMALCKPVVTTTLAADGVGGTQGSDYLVADSPEAFAKAVIKLLSDKPLGESLGQSGRRFVMERFSWEQIGTAITDDVNKLLAEYK